jgi:hypothetical protein
MNALESLEKEDKWNEIVFRIKENYMTAQIQRKGLETFTNFLEKIELPEGFNLEIDKLDFFDPIESSTTYVYIKKDNGKLILSILIELYTTPIYDGDKIHSFESTLTIKGLNIYFYSPDIVLNLDNNSFELNINKLLEKYDNFDGIVKNVFNNTKKEGIKMLKIPELLNIFGDLKPKNKEFLYDFLVDPRTYNDRDEIKEFRQILREMKSDLLYDDTFDEENIISPNEVKFRSLITENKRNRTITIKMEDLKSVSEEEYQYWKEYIETEYNAIMAAGFEKLGIITYYFDLENEETLSEAEADNVPMGEERIEKWNEQMDSKFDLWIELIENYRKKEEIK